jgi:hypothetical protein
MTAQTVALSDATYWTDVTAYVRDFATQKGRQHFLAQIEASTLSMTVDNRSGFFMGNPNQIATRLPIAITATWSGTTYPIYYGITESVDEKLGDVLNTDLKIQASDLLKFLSLRYLTNGSLYSAYAQSTNAYNWYRCDSTSILTDSIRGYNGNVVGSPFGLPSLATGALMYDLDSSIDLTGGTGSPAGYLNLTRGITNPSAVGGLNVFIDFWFMGSGTGGQTILPANMTDVSVGADGCIYVNGEGSVGTPVNDGLWHHIGFGQDYAGTFQGVVVDGVAYATSVIPSIVDPNGNCWLGSTSSSGTATGTPGLGASIDEVVFSVSAIGGTSLLPEVQNRFAAGSLLYNSAQTADAVAQALVIAGFGSVSGGAASVPSFYVDGNVYAPSMGSTTPASQTYPSNGVTATLGITTPVTGTTALSVIQTINDTEIGIFYQDGSGNFNFDTRQYLYRNAGNTAPTGGFKFVDDSTSGASNYDAGTLQIMRDDADVWTTVIVTPQNGTPQTYENVAGEDSYGYSTLTKSTTDVSVQDALQEANYLGGIYQSPLPRVGMVELRSETNNGGNLATMLSSDLQKRVTFHRQGPGAVAFATDMVIEQINHSFTADPGSWHTDYVLDPYAIRFSTQASPLYFTIFDDATYGVRNSSGDFGLLL